ncbi:MAG TPA: energy transducer TonB [Vicinamibacterales bacterium]|nr:energy transducer TonB [Vicinamibacterales bacterium]
MLILAGSAGQLTAQSQDSVIVSSRQQTQQGNHDAAIAILRGGLNSRPNDEALKHELASVLGLKASALSAEVTALRREISALRGQPAMTVTITPGRTSASGIAGATPVRVGGDVRQPMKLIDVKPVYPPIALSARVQGMVIVEGVIDTQGNVSEARVLRGVPLLNEAALDAVRQWQYTPTLLNGVPVPVIMTMTVTFTLQDR